MNGQYKHSAAKGKTVRKRTLQKWLGPCLAQTKQHIHQRDRKSPAGCPGGGRMHIRHRLSTLQSSVLSTLSLCTGALA
jgi:hypothetical protein